MTLVFILATICVVFISIAIGLIVRRHLSDFDSYTSFRSSVGVFGITTSIIGNIIGGGVFFVVGSMAYDAGIAPLSILFSYMIGFALLAWLSTNIRSIVQNQGAKEMYELIRMRLRTGPSSDRYVFLLSTMTLCVYFFSLAGQFLVLGTFLKFVFPESTASVVVLSMVMMAMLTFVYAAWGGLPKDIFTDMFQTTVILIAVISGIVMLFLHPPSMNTAQLPPETFNGLGYGIVFPIAVILFFSPTYLARYDIWQRIIAAKSNKVFRRSLLISIPPICAAYGLFVFLGIYARANGPGDSIRDSAVLWSLKEIMPTSVFLLIILGLYAAVMSTADTLLNVSTLSSWKLFSMIRPAYAEKMKNIKSIRKISILVGILACGIIAIAPDIVEIIMGAFSSIVIFSPSILYVLSSKRPSATVAFFSAAPSYLIFWGLYLAMPSWRLYAFIPCAILSIFNLLLGIMIMGVSKRSIKKV